MAYNWQVYSAVNTNYDGVDQSSFPEAPVLTYTNLEAFAQSFRNSKHTAKEIYQSIFPNQSFYDGLQGVTAITAGSSIGQATGVAGYVKNGSAVSGINGNGVALFGCGTAEVDNAATWGINTLLQDSSVRAVGNGNGRKLISELDYNVMNPNTQVIGLSIGGNSLAQPAIADGFIVNPLGQNIQWSGGFVTENGAATYGMVLGLSAATLAANTSGQPALLRYGDSNGVQQGVTLQATSSGPGNVGGYLVVGGSSETNFAILNGNILISSAKSYVVGGNPVVGARIPGYGNPTGNMRISDFAGGSASTAQTAQLLSQLIIDLKTHGLIGA